MNLGWLPKGICDFTQVGFQLGSGVNGPRGAPVASGDTSITPVTITNGSASVKTDEIVTFGLPLSLTAVGVGQVLRVYDDNGSGAKGSALANFQIDQLSTDLNSKQRFARLTGIVPSLGSAATRVLYVEASGTAAPTGTAITATDLLATAFRIVATLSINGTEFAFDSDTALAAGTTFSKTDYRCIVASSGSACTEWYVDGPPKNAGTPHASGDGTRVCMAIRAFKAGTGVVDGGNPITCAYADVWVENGAADRVSPAHYYYGYKIERATSLSDGTLITTDDTDADGNVIRYLYARSQPAVTLTPDFSSITAWRNSSGSDANDTATYVSGTQFTISGDVTSAYHVGRPVRLIGTTTGTIYGNITASSYFAPNTTITVSWVSGSLSNEALTSRVAGTGAFMSFDRASGSFDTDILGAPIVTADMTVTVVERTSSTRVKTYCISDTHPVSTVTNYISGNWTVEGIGHHYNVPVSKRRAWVGTKPTNVSAWGDCTVSAGTAIAPTTRAPLAYWAASLMGLNWQRAFASVTHNMTDMNLMRASDGSRRPLTFRGAEGTNMGYVETDLGLSGWHDYGDIGPVPVWCVDGMAKFTADGRRIIFENGEYWATWQYLMPPRYAGTPSAGELGTTPRTDGGVTYVWNTAFSGTDLLTPATTWWPYDGDTAHHPAGCYIPWLLTGDLFWLIQMQRQHAYSCWASIDGTVGANKTPVGLTTLNDSYPFGYGQTRGKGWKIRDAAMAYIATPDSLSANIAVAKAYYTSRMTDIWTVAKAYGPSNVLSIYTGVDATPQFFGLNSDRNFSFLSSEYFNEWWQADMAGVAVGMAREIGAMDANGGAFLEWLAKGAVGRYNATGIEKELMVPTYGAFLKDAGVFTTWPASFADVYQRSCFVKPVDTTGDLDGNWQRTPTGTLTLSDATVGAGRTFTFSNSYFASGGTGVGGWYVGGYIRDTASGGRAAITGVTSGTELVCTIEVAFGSITPTISGIRIPGPHPSDYTGYAATLSGDYPQFYVATARLGIDAGYQTTALGDAITWMTGRTGYSELRANFEIALR